MALAAGFGGGALLAVAALPTWVAGAVDDPVLGHHVASGTGSTLAPAAVGLGLVCLAAVVVAAISGRIVRLVAGALIVAGAGAAAIATARVLADPASALAGTVGGTLGRSGAAPVTDAALTPWPVLAFGGAFVAVLGGLLILVRGGSWNNGAGSRYENPASATGASSVRPPPRRRTPHPMARATLVAKATPTAESRRPRLMRPVCPVPQPRRAPAARPSTTGTA